MAESLVGSPMYMSPECLMGNPYNTKADIYSLGVLLFEMILGFYPYEGSNIPDLIKEIGETPLNFVKKNGERVSHMTEEFLRKML